MRVIVKTATTKIHTVAAAVVVIVVVVVVVLTSTRIIKSVVKGRAPVTVHAYIIADTVHVSSRIT